MVSGKANILVVDDEQSIRYLLEAMLKHLGYECTSAPDVDTASRLFDQQPFDLVVLDIMMPGKSGLDFLPVLLARDPDIAVVMLTAVPDVAVAVKAMREGAGDYITKPIELEHLAVRAARALERRSLRLRERTYRAGLEQMVAELTEQVEQRNRELAALRALLQHKAGELTSSQDAWQVLEKAVGGFATAVERIRSLAQVGQQ
ncbi:MAG: response regulator [Chloroflexi bacterium]|nr:response regulator [Chloroflexota bacterium]